MGTASSAQAKSSAATRTAKIEKRIDKWQQWKHEHESARKLLLSKKNRWMLYLNQQGKPCWEVKLRGPLQLCMAARQQMRVRTKELRKVEATIEQLESQLLDVGNEDDWKCIHRYERDRRYPAGSAKAWATHTGNGYYGGLQMDIEFQRTHGLDLLRAKGTADRWTDREQMMVAERARRGLRTSLDENGKVYIWQDKPRGYNPWPNTARSCGLLV
jgi:hypothetical protein